MIVVDAGAVGLALVDDAEDGDRTRARVAGQALIAPEILDLEVTSMLRHLVRQGELPLRRAELALVDLIEMPIIRAPHKPLLRRCWELRDDLAPCDAGYVALAELMGSVLLTTDDRLSRAPGVRCAIEVITSAG